MEKLGRNRDHIKILPGALRRGRRHAWTRRRRSARSSTAWCTTTAASPRCRSRSALMPPASIPTGRCRRSRKPTPARAAASASIALGRAREPHRAPARAAARRLWRARHGRHAQDHRRPDGGMAGRPKASDGFNIMFPYLPGGLDDFVDKVVPELQRRGMFRTEYEGTTLRENLGLPRPEEPLLSKH